MNLKEFKEMQIEFGDFIYKYENFVKAGIINDSIYNQAFYNNLVTLRKFEIENSLIAQAIQMKNEGKSIDEVNTLIANTKTAYDKEKLEAANKLKKTKEIADNTKKLTQDEIKEIEEKYLEFCVNCHPVVKCKVTETEQTMFGAIRQMYYENNISAFRELLENNKDTFKPVEYEKKEFIYISGYYYDMRISINKDYGTKINNYPYNKFETLKDEITIAREAGDIRARESELRKVNEELQKDAKLNLGFEIKIA